MFITITLEGYEKTEKEKRNITDALIVYYAIGGWLK